MSRDRDRVPVETALVSDLRAETAAQYNRMSAASGPTEPAPDRFVMHERSAMMRSIAEFLPELSLGRSTMTLERGTLSRRGFLDRSLAALTTRADCRSGTPARSWPTRKSAQLPRRKGQEGSARTTRS